MSRPETAIRQGDCANRGDQLSGPDGALSLTRDTLIEVGSSKPSDQLTAKSMIQSARGYPHEDEGRVMTAPGDQPQDEVFFVGIGPVTVPADMSTDWKNRVRAALGRLRELWDEDPDPAAFSMALLLVAEQAREELIQQGLTPPQE
jgi:hypothetical protein